MVIENDGTDIPDTIKEKVFERLGKTNGKASGKGPGPYLVKTLVEDFHDTIHVKDQVKGDHTKGARFVVTPPAIK